MDKGGSNQNFESVNLLTIAENGPNQEDIFALTPQGRPETGREGSHRERQTGRHIDLTDRQTYRFNPLRAEERQTDIQI